MKLKLFCLTLILAACTTLPSTPAWSAPPVLAPGPVGKTARTYAVEMGWFNGQPISYYNFGSNTPLRADDPTRVEIQPVWVFATGVAADGSPNKLAGQDSLFDVKPGDPNYTDLWQPHFVTPSTTYQPNSIKAFDALNQSGLKVEKQAMFVNCPIVPPDSILNNDETHKLIKGWVKGQPVVYFDFGVTNPTPNKVYIFITGFDAQQQPQYVAGQHVLFDSKRGSAGYSDFRLVQWVTVDASYQADSIKSVSEIKYKIESSKIVVNYPQK